jgi:thiamine biosynthesis lipoprotein
MGGSTAARRGAGALLLAAMPWLLAACGERLSSLALSGRAFGTSYSVTVVAPPAGLDARGLGLLVEHELAAVDACLSSYRSDSELAAFNRAPAGTWVAVSPCLAAAAETAIAVARASGGAFDPTIAPLARAWGFGAGAVPLSSPPPADVIAAARARVDYRRIATSIDPPALRRQGDVEIDLTALGEGHAVDRIAAALEAAGVSHYLVELGGELRSRGHSQRGDAWRIGVEVPGDMATRAGAQVLRLADAAVATSGTHRQSVEVAGQRLSHLVDPRLGRPVPHAAQAVTVVADSAMLADAWATALAVLGGDAGFALAERRGIAALFVQPGGATAYRATAPLQAYLAPVRQPGSCR